KRGVVDEGVDPSEARERLGGQPLRVALARDVARDGERLAAARLDLRDDWLAIQDVRRDDARALGGEADAVGASDAARAAADNDDLTREAHGVLLLALAGAALLHVPARDLFARREPHALVLAHELDQIFQQLHARGPPADERMTRQHEAGVLPVHGDELG